MQLRTGWKQKEAAKQSKAKQKKKKKDHMPEKHLNIFCLYWMCQHVQWWLCHDLVMIQPLYLKIISHRRKLSHTTSVWTELRGWFCLDADWVGVGFQGNLSIICSCSFVWSLVLVFTPVSPPFHRDPGGHGSPILSNTVSMINLSGTSQDHHGLSTSENKQHTHRKNILRTTLLRKEEKKYRF